MNNKAWTISVAASILLVVGVVATLFGSGYRLFVVATPSMGTVAPVGTLVAVHPEAAYRVGDIVTYERKNRSYTHRIVDITDQGYITKGDINDATDALPVQPDEVVGLVTVRLRYAGFLLQGLPWILIGCAVVYVITLLPRVRQSWRWQIRFIGWSLVLSAVMLWFRPWGNLVLMGYNASGDGVAMHLVSTGIFPVKVLGTVLQSGQDAVVQQNVMDSSGRYTVIPQLALTPGWFLLLLAICLTPMLASLLIKVEDTRPAEATEVAEAPVEKAPVNTRRRVALLALVVTTSVVLVALVLQWSTQSAFAASINNSTNNAVTRTWFTCQSAEVGTSNARFVWGLTATGNQTDLTTNGRTGTYKNLGTAATASASSPCPHDTQGSLKFNGGTCIYTQVGVVGTETFSEEIWFNTTNVSLNGKLMGFTEAPANPATQTKYDRHIYIDENGRVLFGVYPGGQAVVSSPAGKNWADGTWHQVIATSAPGKISLYLDGNLISSRSDTAGQDVSFTGYWEVGCGLLAQWQDANGTPQNFSSYYTGNLRLAAVYDKTLSATEVKDHYVAGTA